MNEMPDFFQGDTDEARRAQVAFLKKCFQFDDGYLASVVEMEPKQFESWQADRQSLHTSDEDRLRQMWVMFLHLFSLFDFDYGHASQMLVAKANKTSEQNMPWSGESIRDFLERRGSAGVKDVNSWLTSLRFTDRYGAKA